MTLKAQWKGFLWGALFFSALAGLLAAASRPTLEARRFTIDSSSGDGVFVLDTVTGQVWGRMFTVSAVDPNFYGRKIDDEGRLLPNAPLRRK